MLLFGARGRSLPGGYLSSPRLRLLPPGPGLIPGGVGRISAKRHPPLHLAIWAGDYAPLIRPTTVFPAQAGTYFSASRERTNGSRLAPGWYWPESAPLCVTARRGSGHAA